MSKTTLQQTKDPYPEYQQNANRFFDDCEKSVSQYHQSVGNLQREYLESCRKIVESAISSQQEFANRSGINPGVPEAAQKITNDVIEAANKSFTIQNKAAQAATNTAIQNIKAFNDNAKTFAELNRSVAQLWVPAWTSKQQ